MESSSMKMTYHCVGIASTKGIKDKEEVGQEEVEHVYELEKDEKEEG